MSVVVGDAVDRCDPLQHTVVCAQILDAAFDDDVHQQVFVTRGLPPVHVAGRLVDVVASSHDATIVQAPLARQRQGVDFARVAVLTPSAPVLRRISSTCPESCGPLPSTEVGQIQLQPRDRPPLHRRHRTSINQVLRA
jgi:hypothetical protein